MFSLCELNSKNENFYEKRTTQVLVKKKFQYIRLCILANDSKRTFHVLNITRSSVYGSYVYTHCTYKSFGLLVPEKREKQQVSAL